MPGIGVGSAEEKKFRGLLGAPDNAYEILSMFYNNVTWCGPGNINIAYIDVGPEDEGKRAQHLRAGSNEVKKKLPGTMNMRMALVYKLMVNWKN